MRYLSFMLLLILFIGGCTPNTTEKTQIPYELPTELPEVAKLLDSVFVEDQKERRAINDIIQKYGRNSEEIKSHWQKISKTDASNLALVEQVLEKYGWLSAEEIGATANTTLFLVIQHADQKTQEKYLPVIKNAVLEGKANSQDLALLEDRVLLGKGEPQIYGSQIGVDQDTGQKYVRPMIDPARVNQRRAEVGLGAIEEYAARFDIKWDLEAYEKKLPELTEKLKQSSW
ncbi:MAG: DUF6624 domain-containing protein [Bacteroidota bacterium]